MHLNVKKKKPFGLANGVVGSEEKAVRMLKSYSLSLTHPSLFRNAGYLPGTSRV